MVLLTTNGGGDLIDYLLGGLFQNDVLQVVIEQVSAQITMIAIGLALLFYAIMLGYNYLKKAISSLTSSDNDGSIFDIQEAIRTVVTIIVISIYTPVILPTVNGFVMTVNKLTTPSLAQQEKYFEVADKYYQEIQQAEKEKKKQELTKIIQDNTGRYTPEEKETAQNELDDIDGNWLDAITNIFAGVKAAITSLIVAGISSIGAMIKLVVGMLILLIFKILLVLGPLALAVSIIPAYKGQVDVWFGTTIGAGLSLTTMHVIDHIFFAIMSTSMAAGMNGEFEGGDGLVMIILALTLAVTYLMTFWLTTKWIGKGDAGRVITKGITLAALAAGGMMAMKGASGSGGAAMKNTAETFNKSQNKASQIGKTVDNDE